MCAAKRAELEPRMDAIKHRVSEFAARPEAIEVQHSSGLPVSCGRLQALEAAIKSAKDKSEAWKVSRSHIPAEKLAELAETADAAANWLEQQQKACVCAQHCCDASSGACRSWIVCGPTIQLC